MAEIRAERAKRTKERCKTLAGFVREAWHVLEPNARYIHSQHIDAICSHLEAVTAGTINRLLINVPPGSMKSLLASVLWQAWEWGPMGLRSNRFLTTAFNDGPVKRDTRKCRDLIMSEWYQSLWPEVRLTRTGETSFANSDTGTREGVAFASLTSQRADRLIVDDPHSVETAESATERQNTTRRFREGAVNRLNDQERSAIVVIMQRLHEDDVSGVIIKMDMGYVHLCLPMEFEVGNNKETSIGFSDWRHSDGELLAPERFSREVVNALKRDMGSYAFAGQYQQRPAPREGGLFQRRWFEIVQAAPARGKRVRSWDLAASSGKGDWSVGVLVLRDEDGIFYIEDIQRLRGSAHEVEYAIARCGSQDGKQVSIRIPEDPGQAGKGQAEYIIRRMAGYTITSERETGSKEVRASAFSAQCEAGNVKLVSGPWVSAFLEEIEMFPNGSHDDQVDAAAGAFNKIVGNRSMPVITSSMIQQVAAFPHRRY